MPELAVTTQTFVRYLTIRLLEQGNVATRVEASLQTFSARHKLIDFNLHRGHWFKHSVIHHQNFQRQKPSSCKKCKKMIKYN